MRTREVVAFRPLTFFFPQVSKSQDRLFCRRLPRHRSSRGHRYHHIRYTPRHSRPGPPPAAPFANRPMVLFLIDVLTNCALTGLIAGRLYWVGRRSRVLSGRTKNRYRGVVLALVESGALLTLTMGAYTVVSFVDVSGSLISDQHRDSRWRFQSKLLSLVSYSLPRVVGMVPLMILLVSLLRNFSRLRFLLTACLAIELGIHSTA